MPRGEPNDWTSAEPGPVLLPRLVAMTEATRPASESCSTGRALVLLRVLPAEGRGGRAHPVALDQRARAAAPDVRLGHLRRRRHDPRPHHRDHRPDRPRDLAAPDGAPDLRGPHHRGDRRHPAAARRTPACATCWRCAATRPAAPARPGRAPRAASSTPPSWWSSSGPARTGCASGWRPSRRATATPRASTRDAAVMKAKHDAGAEFAVTEMVLRASDYFGLVERCPGDRRGLPDRPRDHADPEPQLDEADGRALRPRDARRDAGPDPAAARTTRPRSAPRASRSPPSCATSCSTAARPACTSTR